MQNLDIYILTAIVATLFLVFVVGIWRTMSEVGKEFDSGTYRNSAKEGGPRAALFHLLAGIFANNAIPKAEKKIIHKAVAQTIADMESDGVYFSSDIIEKLKKQREELYCEYSGLPSPAAYDVESNKLNLNRVYTARKNRNKNLKKTNMKQTAVDLNDKNYEHE